MRSEAKAPWAAGARVTPRLTSTPFMLNANADKRATAAPSVIADLSSATASAGRERSRRLPTRSGWLRRHSHQQ